MENVLLLLISLALIYFLFSLIKSKILERYFLLETIKPFLTCLFLITFVMMLDKIIELLNIIIQKNLDVITVVKLFTLSLPFIFALSVPMSVLTSSIMTFGRMSVDTELTAAKSTGINIYKMTNLLISFLVLITVGMAYFNDFVLPETNHSLKNLMVNVQMKKPITAINPGSFTTMNSLTIYAKDRIDETLYDIIIFNLENSRFPQTIQAKRGQIFIDPKTDQLKVVLFDGEMFERETQDAQKFTVTKFDTYTIYRNDLGYDFEDASSDYRGNREMTSTQIKESIIERLEDLQNIEKDMITYREQLQNIGKPYLSESEQTEYRRFNIMLSTKESQKEEIEKQLRFYSIEIHKKYSLALACIIFLLVGIPIGMMTQTSGVSVSFVMSSVLFIIYYVFLVLGEEFGSKGLMNPVLSMWLPSILYCVLAIILIYFSSREKQFNLLILASPFIKIYKKLRR